MNIPSKKSNIQNCKSPSSHNKQLKRSKSTQLLMPKKTQKKHHEQINTDEIFYMHTLSKSKSLKSIKPKPKSCVKVDQPKKKSKGKKNSDTKTLKKHRNLQSQQGTSILTVTSDLQTKNNCKEFFFYCNNYIPIQNSAQRRLVYKLQMIDLQNKTTTDSFHRSKFQTRQTSTQLIQTKDMAVGSALTYQSCEVQTQKQKFEQSIHKCFVDVLTDLQFLYLPNQDNFSTFSYNQRVHYGELLETLARKMLGGTKSLVTNNCLSDDQITVLLYQRQGIQVGALQYVPLDGFPTHLLSILAYLKNLFCFIEYAYKEEVLANLRTFYGLNYNEKVSRLTKKLPHTKDARPVLSQQIFQAFQQEMFKDYQFSSQVAKQAVHWHNKAIFDSVSDQLQVFRPFYSSQGQPFPWTNNLGMTHYDITQQALFIIFVQAKQKVQRQIVTLCGLHLDVEGEPLPKASESQFYQKKMQDKIQKMVIEQVKLLDDKVDLDYVISELKFKIAQDIYCDLIDEFQRECFEKGYETCDEQVFDFQYFN